MGEGSTAFPAVSPTPNSTKNTGKLESFLSLLKWGHYLVTPKKFKDRNMEPTLTSSPKSSTFSPDMRKAYYSRPILSPSLRSRKSDSLKLGEPGRCFPTLSAFRGDYDEGQPVDEGRLSNLTISPNSESERESSDKEVNHWNYRVLFPPLDPPVTPKNRCVHVNHTHLS